MKKVNLDRPFTDCFGEEIKGKNMAEQISMNLFNLSTLHGVTVSADKKYEAYKLCNRIAANPREVELTSEERVLIEDLSEDVFSAGAYGQIVDIIEETI